MQCSATAERQRHCLSPMLCMPAAHVSNTLQQYHTVSHLGQHRCTQSTCCIHVYTSTPLGSQSWFCMHQETQLRQHSGCCNTRVDPISADPALLSQRDIRRHRQNDPKLSKSIATNAADGTHNRAPTQPQQYRGAMLLPLAVVLHPEASAPTSHAQVGWPAAPNSSRAAQCYAVSDPKYAAYVCHAMPCAEYMQPALY